MAESSGDDGRGKLGIVLAGGGARGAYEMGALSVVLPRLREERQERPDIIVGTSVGAINAAYLAATADEQVEAALQRGCAIWERIMNWDKAVKPLLSYAQVRLALRSAADTLGIPGVHTWSFLSAAPLERTLTSEISFGRIHANVQAGELTTAAVVATRASTSLSVVFYDGNGDRRPRNDPRRGIEYRRTADLGLEHVLASAAIPGAFPAVEVAEPPAATGWYYDGGTRLNTPIKPAIDLGAERLVIVALQFPKLGETGNGSGERPEVANGCGQLLQGLLIDPLVNDLYTLTTFNQMLGGGATAAAAGKKPIHYILIAPEEPFELGRIAERCYRARYTGLRNLPRRYHSVGCLGRLLDVGDDQERGELLSYLFFDQEFAGELVELGRRHAKRWFDQVHDDGPWRLRPPP
jgi:NTE family protein